MKGGTVPEHDSKGTQAGSVAPETTSPENEEWVFTIDTQTGEVHKVEKIDRVSGRRQELSEEEYLTLAGYDLSGADDYSEVQLEEEQYDPYTGDYGVESYDPYGFEEGYYQAWADCEAASGSEGFGYSYSPEDAYYQGFADYQAYVYGSVA
jgi:hypothetical protein